MEHRPLLLCTADKTSFDRAKHWIKALRQKAGADIVIALAGNTDADPSGERIVTFEVIIIQHWLT